MSRSKKIVFISHFYKPHIGGVEKHIEQILPVLTKHGDITIITDRYQDKLSSSENMDGVSIRRFKYHKRKILGLLEIWIKMTMMLNLFFRADIIHIHDVFIWIIPIRIILFWKKFYITYHGWEGKYPIPFSSIMQKKISQLLVDGSIAVGKYIEEIYSIKPSYFVYGGVTSFRTIRQKVKKKKGLVFVGRLDHDTGIKLLLEALMELKIYNCKFIGDGDYKKECSIFGKVLNSTPDVSKYMEKYTICVASGFLTTLESLNAKCITVVITDTKIREKAFITSPYVPWIHLCNSKEEIIKVLSSSLSGELQYSKKGYLWSTGQKWDKIAKIYLQLWH